MTGTLPRDAFFAALEQKQPTAADSLRAAFIKMA